MQPKHVGDSNNRRVGHFRVGYRSEQYVQGQPLRLERDELLEPSCTGPSKLAGASPNRVHLVKEDFRKRLGDVRVNEHHSASASYTSPSATRPPKANSTSTEGWPWPATLHRMPPNVNPAPGRVRPQAESWLRGVALLYVATTTRRVSQYSIDPRRLGGY